MTIERVRNWDHAIVEAVRPTLGQPFEWGVTDCGTLARLLLGSLYGDAVATEVLGSPWRTEAGALRRWKKLGGVQGVLDRLGAEKVHASYASAGDLAVIPGEDEGSLPQLGIVMGPKVAVSNRDVGVHAAHVTALPDGAQFWRLP